MALNLKNKRVSPLPYDDNSKPLAGLCLPIVDGVGNILGWSPVATTDEGDGTLALKVDTELSVDSLTLNINNLKVAGIDQLGGASLRYIKTDADGTVHVTGVAGGLGQVNVAEWGGVAQTGDDLTPYFQNLDAALSTRATEATLIEVRDELDTVEAKLQEIIDNTDSLEVNTDELEAKVQSVRDQLDVLLSTRASEATLLLIEAKDFATETTLALIQADIASILAQLDVALSTRASEATLLNVETNLDDVKTKLDTLIAKDYATETTLALVSAAVQSLDTDIDVALSTRASEATLATLLTTTAFEARINTFGQKTMAASTPVVLASDQAAIPVDIEGGDSTASTVTVVARSAVSVTLLASNSTRRGSIIFNDSTANLFVKLGAVASTASFTTRLGSQDTYEVPFNYVGIIDGIWASAGAGDAKITELT